MCFLLGAGTEGENAFFQFSVARSSVNFPVELNRKIVGKEERLSTCQMLYEVK